MDRSREGRDQHGPAREAAHLNERALEKRRRPAGQPLDRIEARGGRKSEHPFPREAPEKGGRRGPRDAKPSSQTTGTSDASQAPASDSAGAASGGRAGKEGTRRASQGGEKDGLRAAAKRAEAHRSRQIDDVRREIRQIDQKAGDDAARPDLEAARRAAGVKRLEVADPGTQERLDRFCKEQNPNGYRRRHPGGLDRATEQRLQQAAERKKAEHARQNVASQRQRRKG